MRSTLHGRGVGFLTFLTLMTGSASGADSIGTQMRNQVEKSRSQLGQLQPWQEEAFTYEVLASSGRFIRDYASQGGVVTRADVDLEGIRRYLAFHSDQLSLQNRTTLLVVQATDSCASCVSAASIVRRDLKERLERRGLRVILLSGPDAAKDPRDLLLKKNAAGWVAARLINSEDPDHPGDYRNELSLEFRFPGTALAQVRRQMEALSTDPLEVLMSRMAVDGLSEMGTLVRQARIGSLEAEGNEGIEVSVEGITSFAQVLEMKRALQKRFQGSARVTEKRVQRGQVALAIVGEVKSPEVSRALEELGHSQLSFKVISDQGQVLQVSAKPRG